MTESALYASYAVLQEINRREFRKKLGLFPEGLHHYVIMAAGIIGAENARRVTETPAAVVKDSEDFAAELQEMMKPDEDDTFRGVLETCLVEAMKDELRFCCFNCSHFNACIDLENLSIGQLFRGLAEGHDSEELRKELADRIDHALRRIPHLETDEAQILCKDFQHQYTASSIGEVFNRYADIAAGLQHSLGIDYRKLQQQMISLNMEFYAKSRQ